jgi:hypothetical protein
MRFERKGGPPDLEAAFQHLIVAHLRGRVLDENHAAESAKGQFPDFGCFRDIVLIEMKHLEIDQHERINNVIDTKLDPSERPVFYGTRDARFMIDAASNSAEINSAITSKLGRTIEKVLSKANRQFRDYVSRHTRKNPVRICVILNSALREWSPSVIVDAINRRMKIGDDELRFSNIDAVLYISEKHMRTLADGRPAHGIVVYLAKGAMDDLWKVNLLIVLLTHGHSCEQVRQ